jgi:hypothetical protein
VADDDPTPLRQRDAWDLLLNPSDGERLDAHAQMLDAMRGDLADLRVAVAALAERVSRLDGGPVVPLPTINARRVIAQAKREVLRLLGDGGIDERAYAAAMADLTAAELSLDGHVPD